MGWPLWNQRRGQPPRPPKRGQELPTRAAAGTVGLAPGQARDPGPTWWRALHSAGDDDADLA